MKSAKEWIEVLCGRIESKQKHDLVAMDFDSGIEGAIAKVIEEVQSEALAAASAFHVELLKRCGRMQAAALIEAMAKDQKGWAAGKKTEFPALRDAVLLPQSS